MDEEIKNLSDKIAELLEQRNFRQIKSLINDEMPQDTAQLLEELPEKEMPVIFRLLTKQNAADTFVEMTSDSQEMLINSFSDAELKAIFDVSNGRSFSLNFSRWPSASSITSSVSSGKSGQIGRAHV